MQRSKSFTSIAFEQKQKAVARKASPTRQSRPKPEWNDYLTDPNRFKVAESDVLKKKKMLVSKHNILAPEYQPTKLKSALSTPRSVDNSCASSHKLHSSSISNHAQNRSIHDTEASPMSKKPSQEKKDSLDLLTTPSSDEEFDESEDEDEEEEDNDYLDLDENSDEEDKKYSSSSTKRNISSAHLESDEDDVSNTLESYFAQSKTGRKSSKAKKSLTKKGSSKSPVSSTPSSQAELTAPSQSRPRSTWGTTGRSSLVAAGASSTPMTTAVSPRHHSYASPIAKKRPQGGHNKLDAVSPPIVSPSPITPPHHTAKFIEKADRIADEDLLDIAQNIDHLQQELRLYEELAGKKSILDAEELQLILGTDENGTMNVDSLNQKTVIRYLVSLVCQTMTYTLQSEVKQQQLETELHTMQGKMDEVLRLVTQQQQTNAAYSRYVLTAVPSSVNNPAVSLLSSTPETSAPSSSAAPVTLPPSPYTEEEAAAAASNLDFNSAAVAGNGMFYGTSASDWLFMAAKGTPHTTTTTTNNNTVTPQQPVKESSLVYHTPVPQYEYQLSPETAADLATRTYDMYLHQQQQQQQQQRVSFANETRVKAVAGDNDTASITSSPWDDQYDEMVDRLSYPSSSVTHTTHHKIPSVAHQRHQQRPQPAECVSIVVPNTDLPTPAKPSPHPFQRNLFPNSPPAAKKIYDASLGNYSLIDTYDN